MNDLRLDLHLHTTASDGSDTPVELIKKAKAIGLSAIAITDHDTLGGLNDALECRVSDIDIITGIEFSCHTAGKGGFDCHILGFGFDPTNDDILAAVEHGREMRFFKLEARIKYLAESFGIFLTDDEVSELRSYNAVAKPHLARMLMRRGLADSVADAIDKYLKGAKFPDDRIDAKEAIDAIHSAGGLAVYAHPLGGERERRLTPCELFERVKALKELGIDGLETYYSRYNREDRDFILEVARKFSLLASAGSDYHGENKTVVLGCLSSDSEDIPASCVTVYNELKNRKESIL